MKKRIVVNQNKVKFNANAMPIVTVTLMKKVFCQESWINKPVLVMYSRFNYL